MSKPTDRHIEIFITDLRDRAQGRAIYLTVEEAADLKHYLETTGKYWPKGKKPWNQLVRILGQHMKLLLLLGIALTLSGCFNPGCVITLNDWVDVQSARQKITKGQITDKEFGNLLDNKFKVIEKRPVCEGSIIWSSPSVVY